jgi:simple sugar transport system permease protein
VNIGAEGQIILGAVFATWAIRTITLPQTPLRWSLTSPADRRALWGLLTGVLRVNARVHENFAGLGLNFIATALVIWLIFNPWKPERGATMSAQSFPDIAPGSLGWAAPGWLPWPSCWRCSR